MFYQTDMAWCVWVNLPYLTLHVLRCDFSACVHWNVRETIHHAAMLGSALTLLFSLQLALSVGRFKDKSSSNAFTRLHCVYVLSMCLHALHGVLHQKTWNYACEFLAQRHWLDEWTSASGRVYTEVTDTFSCYLQEESYEKVEKNVLYNVHEFQTWSNDLKRRGPAGLRDLPCFPYLPLPSSQCPKKHLNSHLLWKRLDRTALAPASCAAGCSFVRSLLRRNH